jgi:NB-ARC domain/Rx N-terminal domain
MAEITVAIGVGWVVSPIISLVINKIHTYVENKYFKKAGIEAYMKKMKTTLKQILSVMRTVEKQTTVDPPQAQLAREIKDAIYDAEDIIDEFEYYVLAEKSEQQQKTVSVVASSSCSCRALHQFIIGDKKFKKKVIKVSESLDQAQASAQILLELLKVTISENLNAHEYENWHFTSSLISDEIIGREEECGSLINLLLRKSGVSSSQTSPTIIPIVGVGGIGKTTLAQMVFNDPSLNGHFDQKLWLTVSVKFDILRLTKEMLNCVCENFSTENVSFDKLQRKLETEFQSKKFLLILDDVWYDRDEKKQQSYERKWLQFLAPLRRAEHGSKIVLTTRDPTVVKCLLKRTEHECSMSLSGLSENDGRSLFEMCAFDHENQHKREELELIGIEMVRKLKGLPLAIRVVGTQLRGNSDVEEWKRTLNDNPLDTSDIMTILLRSYEHLPENLKRCFAYCSLFPKDYRLKPDRLIHMWIAQGFIISEGRKKLEDVGKSYFKGLLGKSFFQVIKRDNKKYYFMHDLMHDLACHVSKDECYILDIDNEDSIIKNLGSIRHLSVTHHPNASHILENMIGIDNLRTLILLDLYKHGSWYEKDLSNLFELLKKIRVLDLGGSILSLCKLGENKHLRYLSLRDKFDAHDSFRKLHHLTTLFIRRRPNLTDHVITLPKFVCSMSSLELIDTSKSLLVDVGGLVQLQSLLRGSACLHINNKKKKGHQIDILEDMDNIKGCLEIRGLENVTSREEALKANLTRKQHVSRLIIHWSKCSSLDVQSSKYQEVLEALGPNPSLKRLKINGYPGAAWPSWIESNSLFTVKSIELYNCEGIKMLPALGQLPVLQNLQIEGLTAVRKIGLEFYGTGRFPSLEELSLRDLTSLEEWSYTCDMSAFPKLHSLMIWNCPLFIGSEWDGFPALQYLIFRCPSCSMKNKSLFQGNISLVTLTRLQVDQCKGLITLECLHELVSLQRLIICDCPDLLSLPEMEFFYSLEFLAIIDCPELRSFPKKGLPVSLQLLWIGDVHHAFKDQIQSKKGHDWDKIAAISGCNLYSTIEESIFCKFYL